ncbi:MAG TPA: YggU family protein [Candidatus Diapherotrites archaeon]|uniref:UPF0235 protein HA254_00105 n=1 Tax=Candidatus Iainarchaeum sp. TaxID=3101447 RepID=A0A7J4IUE1_9ARCH|nr:YggU family protein [Candidatus Diapherotrites archaeon]
MVIDSQNAELDLEIIANSREFGIAGFNPWTNALRVKVKAKPLKGEANREILNGLAEIFGRKTEIIRGEKNRKKRILVKGISWPELKKLIQAIQKT